ncbi:MAG: class I SAM-dependent methyltransferase [Planctomycetota bacterium]
MGFQQHISESAFLVNVSRALNVELSRDRYAHLWVSGAARALWDDFTRGVYPFDATELGLRNRFFLEQLEAALRSRSAASFVNVGAGFTSYPFLVEEPCCWVEVDYAHVIEFKRDKIRRWQEEGTLPRRTITYLAADLNRESDVQGLGVALAATLGSRPSFFLVEGLTYYLSRPVFGRLFDLITRLQSPGSILTFDFWVPGVENHPIFLRFKQFCSERFGHRATEYNLLDPGTVRSLPGYEVVALTDVQEQETVYSKQRVLASYDAILPENYAVLRRQR